MLQGKNTGIFFQVMDFKNKVYKIVSQIPVGYVATYGQVARLAGHPKAARAVGLLMRNNPNAPTVPCHRVVGWNGKLVGYSASGGLSAKKKLLEQEEVVFKGSVVNLSVSLWRA